MVGAVLIKHGQAGITFARGLFLSYDKVIRRSFSLARCGGNRIISQTELLGSAQLAQPCALRLGQSGVERGQCGGAGGLRAACIVKRKVSITDFLCNLVERCGFLKQVGLLGRDQRGKVVLPSGGIFYTSFQLVAGKVGAEPPERSLVCGAAVTGNI